MAKIKYYQTMCVFSINDKFGEAHNIPKHVRQFTIACATTSYKKANEWAESLGLGKGVFHRDYTYVLERPDLIERCEKYGGFIIETGTKDEVVSILEALRE